MMNDLQTEIRDQLLRVSEDKDKLIKFTRALEEIEQFLQAIANHHRGQSKPQAPPVTKEFNLLLAQQAERLLRYGAI